MTDQKPTTDDRGEFVPGKLSVGWVMSATMATTGAGVKAVDSTLSNVPMISMEAVNKHFGSLHVLRDINLKVDRGQVIVVLGPSGSGKSTLCRTINRLETIDSGTIAIDGEVLPEEGRKLAQLRSDVGMVFQSFNLFAHKTILENVTLAPMRVRKASKEKARESGLASQIRRTSTRRSSPAVSSSAWRLRARWQ
jgi:glutamate transport system ATP-binding protein